MRTIPWSNAREITTRQKGVPTLRITNDARSKVFYGDGLGFQGEWEHRFTPQLPVLLCSKRDEMEILLTEHTGDCPVGGLVHLDVPNVDALCRRLLAQFYGQHLDRAIPLLVEEMHAGFRGERRQEPERHASCSHQQTGR
jgi:Glyoxalase superfamily protein